MPTRIKKGDDVTVISGKWRGEKAKVHAVISGKDRLVLEMSGLSAERKKQVGVRTVRKSPANPNGGVIERAVSVHVSNVRRKQK